MLNPCACRQALSVHGETIRWFRASPCDCRDPRDPDFGDHRGCEKCEHGYVYTEQVIPTGARAMVTMVRREQIHPDLGFIARGDLMCVTMPDEIPLGNWDKIVLLERTIPAKEIVTKGEDVLRHTYPSSVTMVSAGEVMFTRWTPGDGEDEPAAGDWSFDVATGTITWHEDGASPEEGAVYAVEYLFHPVFWYDGSAITVPRPVADIGFLPQSGRLSLKHPSEV